ncbi:hypothetical protein N7451_003289 [Penicillium sp. IBT 35674x]|nr:hypothetical protein N7451_003289 [Penicillium sp. IBT 35674x]
MDWLSHISSDWSSASFNNMAIHSTAPEPRPSISSPIDSALFATYSSEEAFSPNLAVQPSYDSLNSNSFGIRQACNDQMPRNEHQHITMRDDLSRNNSSPTNPALPCSACNSGCQPWPAEPPSGLPITPGRLERLE